MSYTYASLDQFLGNKEEKLIKKSQMQTSARRTGNSISIRLIHTFILVFYKDGAIYLDSGGWQTRTTKLRMNEYLPRPWGIYQEKSTWWVSNREIGKSWPFQDGMRLLPDDTVAGEAEDPKAQQKLVKQVNKYVNDFIDELLAGNVPAPSSGDCWYCSMREAAGTIKTGTLHEDGSLTNQAQVGPGMNGKTLGELNSNADHILSHIEEGYYVPSLLMRAIEMNPISSSGMWVLGSFWQGTKPMENMHDVFKRQAVSSLRKYIKSQLGTIAR